ncbi:DNA mismatch repair protein MutT [Kaistia sp. 32K]|uniref:NUDIX hydrolase n=1 Tax=Kaistia sp. 32K TaxID=2795690 RepID=UPI001915E395|nr:NUDIX hydrolase [Kaistia sp. 32K]BCP55693.1 DNA mismatch repair protein MutT [Kaistia sp. 32K]
MSVIRKNKVVLYATWRGKLLVFREPDFPEYGIQVPGGTMEAGETPVEAARREFSEETGLTAPAVMTLLGEREYRYAPPGGPERQHRRWFFHLALEGEFAESWEQMEMHPDSGGPPIRFALSWLDLPLGEALFGELDAMLDSLPALETAS